MRHVVTALLVVAAVGRADDKKDELSKLEGKWEVVSITAGGKEAKDKTPPPLTIKAGVLTGIGPDMKLTTDATQKPKWLNMTFTRAGMETTVNAIYELDGDTLKICLPLAPAKGSGAVFENKRPAGFDTTDKPEMVIQLKRAK